MSHSLAWAAGLFEGEGTIGDEGRLRIKMTDEDVVRKFAAVVQCGCVTGPMKPSGLGKKPVWEWSISGKHARNLMVAMFPYLGFRRRKRITEVQAARLTKKRKKLSPNDVAEIRLRLADGGRGSGRELAREFGISDGLVSQIKNRKAWQ